MWSKWNLYSPLVRMKSSAVITGNRMEVDQKDYKPNFHLILKFTAEFVFQERKPVHKTNSYNTMFNTTLMTITRSHDST